MDWQQGHDILPIDTNLSIGVIPADVFSLFANGETPVRWAELIVQHAALKYPRSHMFSLSDTGFVKMDKYGDMGINLIKEIQTPRPDLYLGLKQNSHS